MKNRDFYFLATGQSLANLGDVFYILALISIIYGITESIFFVSLVPTINMIAGTLGGLLAPLIIDKYKLKWILVYSQGIKTLLLLGLTIFMLTVLSQQTIYIVFMMIFLITFLDSWANPASSAILPNLISNEELPKANSLLSSLSQFIQLGGWAVGGILSVFLKSLGLFWLTFFLYFCSTLTMSFIKDKSQKEKEDKSSNKLFSLIEGWEIIIRDRSLRTIHILILFESIASVVWVSAFLYPFIQKQLEVGTQWWGYINTSLLLGLFLAGVFGYRKFELLNRKLNLIIVLGSLAVFLTTFLFGINKIPWLALLIIGLYGMFHEIKEIAIHTLIQNIVHDKLLAKVYAAESTIIMLIFGISTVLMGLLGEKFGISVVYIVASLFLGISFILAFKLKNTLNIIGEENQS